MDLFVWIISIFIFMVICFGLIGFLQRRQTRNMTPKEKKEYLEYWKRKRPELDITSNSSSVWGSSHIDSSFHFSRPSNDE